MTKTVVVTGANSGIGFATAMELAARGLNVIMVCRNLEKANHSREIIKQNTGIDVSIMQADLASFASVRTFAESFLNRYNRLDILIEIGESMDAVVCRFFSQGMSPEDIAKRIGMPMEFVNSVLE